MSYKFYNPNPDNKLSGDCVVRAICKVLDMDWEQAYVELCFQGFMMREMPATNRVWGEYLKREGYVRNAIPNTCPDCYTVCDFCVDYTHGKYILGTGEHVVAVVDGNYYDTWDSGDEIPIYFFRKE